MVIVLTNLSDAKMASDALRQGVFDVLVKSNWTLADVVQKVRERLDK